MSSTTVKPLLLLGKQFTKGNPSRIGGVIVLFEMLKKDLDDLGYTYEVIDLNWRNYQTPLHAYITIVWKIVFAGKRFRHASLHGTANEFFFLAPILVFFAKSICHRTVSLRRFAGDFDELFEAASVVKKSLSKYALKGSDAVFFETHYLVEFFKKYNPATFWFPNNRHKSAYRTDGKFARKFVFVGQVKQEKGINELLAAFSVLENGSTLDIYGPIDNEYDEVEFGKPNIQYKGVVDPSDVPQILSEYDVLVLPSYREGYPGVIIEAFSVGVPVITTNLRGIREIVSASSGILVDPKSVDQLIEAINQIDQSTYNKLSVGALNKFTEFETTHWTRQFMRTIKATTLRK